MLPNGDHAFLSVTAARTALVSGSCSAVDYVSTVLQRIEQANRHLHAFISVLPERALQSARQADRRQASGTPLPPLHGIPFAVKDMIDVKDLPTTAHSRLRAPPANKSATSVLRLRRNGAIFIGKLALEEFGIGSSLDDLAWPSPKNPWDLRRTTGGSSSGAAAAVAASLIPLALGTDTRGSIRAPAAYCGLVALKPTDKSVDVRGVLPLSPILDAIGLMARSAADCRLLFAALTGSTSERDFGPATVGLVDTIPEGLVPNDDVLIAMREAIGTFKSFGNRVEHTRFPDIIQAPEIAGAILEHEAYAIHRQRLALHGRLYGETCRQRIAAGAKVGTQLYRSALARRESLRAEVDRLFEKFDVLALPVTFGAAARLDDLQGLERSDDFAFRVPFSVTGHPAIVFCTGFNGDGLPLSMQLVGRRGEDQRLLDLVDAYQQVTSWHEMHPSDRLWGGR